jgi:hypothetical protein
MHKDDKPYPDVNTPKPDGGKTEVDMNDHDPQSTKYRPNFPGKRVTDGFTVETNGSDKK